MPSLDQVRTADDPSTYKDILLTDRHTHHYLLLGWASGKSLASYALPICTIQTLTLMLVYLYAQTSIQRLIEGLGLPARARACYQPPPPVTLKRPLSAGRTGHVRSASNTPRMPRRAGG